jgi:hypothetical protein
VTCSNVLERLVIDCAVRSILCLLRMKCNIPVLEDALSWSLLDGTIFIILAWYFFLGQMFMSFRVQLAVSW